MLSLCFTYLRCGVGSGKNNFYYVPEISSAEQASERYSNEARCIGPRWCVDPEVVVCVDQRRAVRKGENMTCLSARDEPEKFTQGLYSVLFYNKFR